MCTLLLVEGKASPVLAHPCNPRVTPCPLPVRTSRCTSLACPVHTSMNNTDGTSKPPCTKRCNLKRRHPNAGRQTILLNTRGCARGPALLTYETVAMAAIRKGGGVKRKLRKWKRGLREEVANPMRSRQTQQRPVQRGAKPDAAKADAAGPRNAWVHWRCSACRAAPHPRGGGRTRRQKTTRAPRSTREAEGAQPPLWADDTASRGFAGGAALTRQTSTSRACRGPRAGTLTSWVRGMAE